MIDAKGLTMRYGPVVALHDASFHVEKEEVVGLLGPNGAGKSTTMKILTTYIHPTLGTATVGGKSVLEDPIGVRQMIGYLPEVLPLYLNMEVAEYLAFVGNARGVTGVQLRERIRYVVDRCKLRPVYRRPIRELSKGYKQRTALAQALIHDPQVLILDEPTSGLDPRQILDIRDLVRELAASKTVILSTHILQEAEAMADRIIIINQGKIVGTGTLDALRAQAHETGRVRVAIHGPVEAVEKALDGIGEVMVKTLAKEPVPSFELTGPNPEVVVESVGTIAVEKNWRVQELASVPYTLEETFLALTDPGRKLPEESAEPVGSAVQEGGAA